MPRSNQDVKIDWLVANVALWRGWPTNAPYSDANLIQRMKLAGIFSAKTHNIIDLSKLIAKAKQRIRHEY